MSRCDRTNFIRLLLLLLSVMLVAGCALFPKMKEAEEPVTEAPTAVPTETPTATPTEEPTATPEPRYVERGALIGTEYLNPYFNFALTLTEEWFCFPESYIEEMNSVASDLEGYELEKRLKGLDDILLMMSSSLNGDFLTLYVGKQDSRARSLCSESDIEFEEYYNERIRSIHIAYGRKIQSIERTFDFALDDTVLIQTVYENRDGSVVYDCMYYVLQNDYYLLLDAMFTEEGATEKLLSGIRYIEDDFVIPEQEEFEQSAAVLGETMDMQYVNNYFGIGFKIPKDMYIYSERELAQMNNLLTEMTEQEFLNLLSDGLLRYVFVCDNGQNESVSIQISECDIDFFYMLQLDDEEFAEYAEELKTQFAEIFNAMESKQRITFGLSRSYCKIEGRILPYTEMAIKYGRESMCVRTMVVTGGKYCLTITAITTKAEQADAIFAGFFAANSF